MDYCNWTFNLPIEHGGWFQVKGNCYFVTEAAFISDDPGPSQGEGELFHMVSSQVTAYFDNPHSEISLPVMTRGSEFQQKVWTEMEKIPVGQTRTYAEIAHVIGSSPRAVGGACRKNPIAVIVPCHRVVSASGIGGYGGHTDGPVLDMKRWLLQHEV